MAKCQIWFESRPLLGTLTTHTVLYDVPHEAVARCQTHNMPVEVTGHVGSDICPIGRIEEATEQALKAIADAKGQPC